MKHILVRSLWLIVVASTLLIGCTEDDSPTPAVLSGGVLVINEGQFLAENADISYYRPSDRSVQNDIFQTVNGRPLGDVLQSAARINDNMYLVVNNSNKIEVIDGQSAAEVATISGLQLPRYVQQVAADKAYVSEWVGFGVPGQVRVVNTASHTLGELVTGLMYNQPEKLAVSGEVAAVAANAFAGETDLVLINTATDAVIATVPVGGAPVDVVTATDGDFWVLVSPPATFDAFFNVTYDGSPSLVRVDPLSEEIVATYTVPFSDVTAEDLALLPNGTDLAFSCAGTVQLFDAGAGTFSTWVEGSFYGLGVAPDGRLYTADAGGFVAAGLVRIYNSSGTKTDSFSVGVAPNGFMFDTP